MLNSNQSQYRQLGLLIIKVPKAPLHHVPRCYAPAVSINKLTLNEPAIIIGEIINDTISNWDTSRSKITIESFKWRSNCLVLLKLRRLKSKTIT